jgi:hypothetical protein
VNFFVLLIYFLPQLWLLPLVELAETQLPPMLNERYNTAVPDGTTSLWNFFRHALAALVDNLFLPG